MKTCSALLSVFLVVMAQSASLAEPGPRQTPILDDSLLPRAKAVPAPSTRRDADDPREVLAIVFKASGKLDSNLDSELHHSVGMEKQRYDQDNCKAGRILVAGIFQDGTYDAITILQRMHRSEAEEMMKNDPMVKAGLYTASLRRFSAYAPILGTTTKRNEG